MEVTVNIAEENYCNNVNRKPKHRIYMVKCVQQKQQYNIFIQFQKGFIAIFKPAGEGATLRHVFFLRRLTGTLIPSTAKYVRGTRNNIQYIHCFDTNRKSSFGTDYQLSCNVNVKG